MARRYELDQEYKAHYDVSLAGERRRARAAGCGGSGALACLPAITCLPSPASGRPAQPYFPC